jgi:NAD(P)-dependent dehydrogenase (short-subunit alcohol dehydrogenase family)
MSKTLLITGGASGIGAATARLAATRGYKVAINYRSRDAQAKAVVADIVAKGGKAIALPADVAREADIVRMFRDTEKALGPVTHLVNSAGFSQRTRVDEYDAALLEKFFAVNVIGLMLCCREAAKRMSTKHGGPGGHGGGAIVNVSSMASTIGGRIGSSAYAATKGAVDSFTKGFAREVAPEGIRVNSLRPGMVMSEMTEGRLKDAAFRASIEASIPMRRVGEVHEMAGAILYLLSDEASFITGAMLDAAGGGYII